MNAERVLIELIESEPRAGCEQQHKSDKLPAAPGGYGINYFGHYDR